MEIAEQLDVGRRAFDQRTWTDAYRHLAAAAAAAAADDDDDDESDHLEPDDLERLATAAYLTGHDTESTDAWTRAHRAWLARGDPARAVRCGFWLGFGLIQRGDMSQGGGWLARISTLAEEHQLDSVERGYLLVPQALRVMAAGDPATALEVFGDVALEARRFGDADLAALGCIGRGEALLRLGRADEGMHLFDEAMVSVTAGETSSVISGVVYCAVIDACHKAFDLGRAREWTVALDRWCEDQPGLVPYRGQCLVHRAQILQLGGEWSAAVAEAERARVRLSEPPHPAIGMAHYQLGELHRLRGDLQAAEDAYLLAHRHGRNPEPGLALLRLAEGRPDRAAAAIEASLGEAPDQLARAQLLPARVEIMLAASRTDAAEESVEELAGVAEATGGRALIALAAQGRGAVLVARGEPERALQPLREALRAWQEMGAPYETAQVRVLLVAVCRAIEDHEGADLECSAARQVFEEIGAAPALSRLDELAGTGQTPLPITRRELEVLRLVAAGRTNQQVAEHLVISTKTVERHLSNLFTKLGVSNRAAATAWAYDHGVV